MDDRESVPGTTTLSAADGDRGDDWIFPGMDSDRGAFYRAVLDSLDEGVLISDRNWKIAYINRELTQITGYVADDLVGKSMHDVFLPPGHPQNETCQSKNPLSENTELAEIEIVRKDGNTHWVRIKTTPYRNEDGEVLGTVMALSCIERQKALERENEVLHDEIRVRFGSIIGRSAAIQKVTAQIETVAGTDANVLILGESGTGKELVAREIHENSPRKDRSLVRVNCASVPKDLFESEFFGHVRGAFTGAVRDRVGRFELANGGTLFLDEIGEIPLELQSKLLRVLQEGQFERLGEERTRTVQVRVIAATNRDLLAEAKAGRFRLDLYYRLSVFPIEVPALRDRPEDIGLLADHFIRQAARRLGVHRPKLTRLQVRQLEAYDWPGNVRELQNAVERALILSRGRAMQFDLPLRTQPSTETAVNDAPGTDDDGLEELSLDDLAIRERAILLKALRQQRWKIYGADGAAALLNLKPTTLASKMKRFNLVRPSNV